MKKWKGWSTCSFYFRCIFSLLVLPFFLLSYFHFFSSSEHFRFTPILQSVRSQDGVDQNNKKLDEIWKDLKKVFERFENLPSNTIDIKGKSFSLEKLFALKESSDSGSQLDQPAKAELSALSESGVDTEQINTELEFIFYWKFYQLLRMGPKEDPEEFKKIFLDNLKSWQMIKDSVLNIKIKPMYWEKLRKIISRFYFLKDIFSTPSAEVTQELEVLRGLNLSGEPAEKFVTFFKFNEGKEESPYNLDYDTVSNSDKYPQFIGTDARYLNILRKNLSIEEIKQRLKNIYWSQLKHELEEDFEGNFYYTNWMNWKDGENLGEKLNPRSLFLSQNKNKDWKQLTEDAQKILEQLIDFKVLPAEFKSSLYERGSFDAITEENSEENPVQKETTGEETPIEQSNRPNSNTAQKETTGEKSEKKDLDLDVDQEDKTGNAALPLTLITTGTIVGPIGVLVFTTWFFKK